MRQGEVLHQVSSLLSLRLLDQCSGDVLEGQLYRRAAWRGQRPGQRAGAGVRARVPVHPKTCARQPAVAPRPRGQLPRPRHPCRCNLGEDMAEALADNVQLRLGDYLRLS